MRHGYIVNCQGNDYYYTNKKRFRAAKKAIIKINRTYFICLILCIIFWASVLLRFQINVISNPLFYIVSVAFIKIYFVKCNSPNLKTYRYINIFSVVPDILTLDLKGVIGSFESLLNSEKYYKKYAKYIKDIDLINDPELKQEVNMLEILFRLRKRNPSIFDVKDMQVDDSMLVFCCWNKGVAKFTSAYIVLMDKKFRNILFIKNQMNLLEKYISYDRKNIIFQFKHSSFGELEYCFFKESLAKHIPALVYL